MKRYLKELVILLAVFGGLPFDVASDTAYAQTASIRLNGVKFPDGTNAMGGVYNAKAPEYGAKCNGVVDDTTAIQAAINAAFAAGGGQVNLPPGNCLTTGLTLKSGVRLVGMGRGYNESSIFSTKLTLSATGIAIDTLGGGATMANVENMTVVGPGAGTAAKGIRFQAGNWNQIRNVEVTNFADECILLGTGTIANTLEDVVAINCVLNRTRAGVTGAVDIAGADHYIHRVEASTSLGATVTSANLYCVAIAVRGTNNMLDSCVGEISDQGYWIGTGSWNRFVNCRADLNLGHGFRINGGGNSFSACHATRNSQDTDNTYNGFEIDASTAQNNKFSACISSGLAADAKWQKWGFDDNANYAASEARNTFVGCGGQNNRTKLWSFAASSTSSGMDQPPHLVAATNGDTTPTVEGTSYLGLFNYAAPASITNFTNGANGQTLWVYGSHFVTLVFNGGLMITNTGANKVLKDGGLYVFKNNNGIWRELSADQMPFVTTFAQDIASTGASTTLATLATPTAGTYRVSVVVSAHTNNDTVTATVAYTDAVEAFATTLTPISAVLLTHDSNTGTVSSSTIIRASNATSIVVTLSVTAQTTTKATAIIERIN